MQTQNISIDVLDHLLTKGLLTKQTHTESVAFFRGHQSWRIWIDKLCLLLGATLLLSGIIFFFAFNWARIPGLFKLALVETLLLGCLGATWKIGLHRLSGQVMLLSSSIMVGVFLAVFGQVYQTGADAWQLFALWSLLITPWVLLSRYVGLYMTWIILINTAITLFWIQTQNLDHFPPSGWLYIILAGLNALFLTGREILVSKKYIWVSPVWPQRLLWAAIQYFISVPTIRFIFNHEFKQLEDYLALILFLALESAAWIYFCHYRKDLANLMLSVLTCDIVFLCLLGRICFEISHDAGMFLLFGLIIIAVFGLSTRWLLRMRNRFLEAPHV